MSALMPDDDPVVQVSMRDVLLPQLETWFALRGLELVRTPSLDADSGVRQYIVVPALPPMNVKFSGPL